MSKVSQIVYVIFQDFYSSIYIVSFTFRSVTHFELIFVKDVRSRFRFFFLLFFFNMCLFQHHLFRSLFSLMYCLCSFVKDERLQLYLFISGLYFLVICAYSFINTTLSLFGYSFIVSLQVGGVSASLFSLNITLIMLGLLALHINFKIVFLISTKGLDGF